ncbi:MAG: hypothetical protein IT305_06475 [Chloroflexi bacterium]|nr:hypothetical protein [Chloroflexota bacterium]
MYAQRYASDGDGTRQGAEFQAHTFTLGDRLNQAVAMAADGRVLVTRPSFSADRGGSGFGVYAQRYLVDEPPVVGLTAGPLAYIEESSPQPVDGAATVTDVDSPNFSGGALTVTLQAVPPDTVEVSFTLEACRPASQPPSSWPSPTTAAPGRPSSAAARQQDSKHLSGRPAATRDGATQGLDAPSASVVTSVPAFAVRSAGPLLCWLRNATSAES